MPYRQETFRSYAVHHFSPFNFRSRVMTAYARDAPILLQKSQIARR
jgi:hypothetical protein